MFESKLSSEDKNKLDIKINELINEYGDARFADALAECLESKGISNKKSTALLKLVRNELLEISLNNKTN